MARYIARRLLWTVVLMFAVSVVTFVIFYVLPSADPAALRAGRHASPQQIEEIRHKYHLDKSLLDQLSFYFKGILLHGDFGISYVNDQPVAKLVFSRLPATISVAVGAAVYATR